MAAAVAPALMAALAAQLARAPAAAAEPPAPEAPAWPPAALPPAAEAPPAPAAEPAAGSAVTAAPVPSPPAEQATAAGASDEGGSVPVVAIAAGAGGGAALVLLGERRWRGMPAALPTPGSPPASPLAHAAAGIIWYRAAGRRRRSAAATNRSSTADKSRSAGKSSNGGGGGGVGGVGGSERSRLHPHPQQLQLAHSALPPVCPPPFQPSNTWDSGLQVQAGSYGASPVPQPAYGGGMVWAPTPSRLGTDAACRQQYTTAGPSRLGGVPSCGSEFLAHHYSDTPPLMFDFERAGTHASQVLGGGLASKAQALLARPAGTSCRLPHPPPAAAAGLPHFHL